MARWIEILIPAVTAIAGVLIGNMMARRTQQDAVQAVQAERREDRFRTSLGATRTLLIDANPIRVTMNFNADRSPQLIADLRERWDAIRPPLEGAAILESDDDLRTALESLLSATSGVLHWNAWAVGDFLSDRSWREAYNNGREDHDRAITAIDTVAALVRAP